MIKKRQPGTCFTCGKLFSAAGNKKFCSPECRAAEDIRRRTGICECCGRVFVSRDAYQPFCSIRCHNISQGQALWADVRVCGICGRKFRRPKGSNNKYCSPECGAKARQTGNGQEYRALLKSGGCVMCGYNECSAALDFHHVDGKNETISTLKGLRGIKREIEKHPIIVLCANCHRELHAGLFSFQVAA